MSEQEKKEMLEKEEAVFTQEVSDRELEHVAGGAENSYPGCLPGTNTLIGEVAGYPGCLPGTNTLRGEVAGYPDCLPGTNTLRENV